MFSDEIQVGQTVQVCYWNSNQLYEKFAAMKVERVGQIHVIGRRINRQEEYIEVGISDIRNFRVIAQPGEHAMHISKLSSDGSEWYKWQNIDEEAERRFKETYPHLEFIRIDEESFYIIYMTKAEKKESPNRLWGTLVYMIGSIDLCPDNGKTWRKRISPELLKRNIIPLDPLDKPIDIGVEDEESRRKRREYTETGDWERLSENVKVIRHVDLRLVDLASFIICYLDTTIPACGTMEELFWANRQKRPVIVVCPQGKKNIPQWLFGALKQELFFDNFEQMFEYLDYVDSSPTPAHLDRWLFMDYKKLYGQIIPL